MGHGAIDIAGDTANVHPKLREVHLLRKAPILFLSGADVVAVSRDVTAT